MKPKPNSLNILMVSCWIMTEATQLKRRGFCLMKLRQGPGQVRSLLQWVVHSSKLCNRQTSEDFRRAGDIRSRGDRNHFLKAQY